MRLIKKVIDKISLTKLEDYIKTSVKEIIQKIK